MRRPPVALVKKWLRKIMSAPEIETSAHRHEMIALTLENPQPLMERVATLQSQQKYDEAEELIGALRKRFSKNADVAKMFAAEAQRRRDWTSAALRWRQFISDFSNLPDGYVGAGYAERALQRFDEAAQLFAAGLARFPKNSRLLQFSAETQARKSNWLEALGFATTLCEVVPKHNGGFLLSGLYLVRLGRLDEAEQIISNAISQMGPDQKLDIFYANLARMRKDFEEARKRWSILLERYPDAPQVHAGLGEALRRTKRPSESERLLKDSVARFGSDLSILINFALVAHDLGNWTEASKRWSRVREIAPDNPIMAQQSAIAESFCEFERRDELENSSKPEAAKAPVQRQLPVGNEHDLRAFLLNFENLGNDCEFGLVQRRFLAEPLGLLRFIDMPARALVQALDTRFEGVGDPENTELFVYAAAGGEYQIRDKRYNMRTHTCVYEIEGDRESFFLKLCRRTRYLKEKLIMDLEAAEKIFVYQHQGLTDDDIFELRRAMQPYGGPTLLCIRKTSNERRSGEVTKISDGLLVAHRDYGGHEGSSWDINIDEWLEICRKAAELHENLWRSTTHKGL